MSVALATDYNPGSSHMKNMSFVILLSTMKLKMSIEEAFLACTYNAAKSLQLEDSIGSISIGKKADLIIIHTEWNEFKQLNLKKISNKKNYKIYDLRNLYSPEKMKKNKVSYFSIGR